jgi:hypothetical protein
MVFNGSSLTFKNTEGYDVLTIQNFIRMLDGIIRKDFDDKCQNVMLSSKDVNKSIGIVLYILLGINVILLVVFVYLFRKVRSKEKNRKVNSIHSMEEGLLNDNIRD